MMMYVEATLHKVSRVEKFYLQGALGLVYIEICNTGAKAVNLAN